MLYQHFDLFHASMPNLCVHQQFAISKYLLSLLQVKYLISTVLQKRYRASSCTTSTLSNFKRIAKRILHSMIIHLVFVHRLVQRMKIGLNQHNNSEFPHFNMHIHIYMSNGMYCCMAVHAYGVLYYNVPYI